MSAPVPEWSLLCEAPNLDAAEEMTAWLREAGIAVRWDASIESGLARPGSWGLNRFCIGLYVAPEQAAPARRLLLERGVDVESEDYKWQVAGFAGGEAHWLAYKRRVRRLMLIAALALAALLAYGLWH